MKGKIYLIILYNSNCIVHCIMYTLSDIALSTNICNNYYKLLYKYYVNIIFGNNYNVSCNFWIYILILYMAKDYFITIIRVIVYNNFIKSFLDLFKL